MYTLYSTYYKTNAHHLHKHHTAEFLRINNKNVLIPDIVKQWVLQRRSCSDSRRWVQIQEFVQQVINITRNSVPSHNTWFCGGGIYAAPSRRRFNVSRMTRGLKLGRERLVPAGPHSSQRLTQDPQVEPRKLPATHHRLACITAAR